MKKGKTNKISGKIIIRRKDEYYIELRAKDRLKFYRLVGFTIRRKQQYLEEYLRRRGLLGDKPPNQSSPNSFPSNSLTLIYPYPLLFQLKYCPGKPVILSNRSLNSRSATSY